MSVIAGIIGQSLLRSEYYLVNELTQGRVMTPFEFATIIMLL
jgi:hypothetical protein